MVASVRNPGYRRGIEQCFFLIFGPLGGNMRFFQFLGLVISLICAGSALTAQVYICQLTPKGNSWIMETIVFEHDEATDKILVNDAMTQAVNKSAVAARITQNDANRLSLTWTLKNVRAGAKRVNRFEYALTLFRKSGKARVRALPLGFDATFFAKGRCNAL